ncbi:MAG: arginase family protein, partial [Ignavibacteriaceae bacterium]|nr:arginase family protein [Ignavibacteriaceae bacterium]
MPKENVVIIGFPMDLGADRRGVDMGPSALRIAGLQKKLENLGYKVEDTGDIKIEIMEKQKIKNPKLKYLAEIIKTSKKLAEKVEKVLDNGDFPLCIGGDHSIALGTISGISTFCKKKKLKLGVIWIDAHSDMNTEKTSPSGNIHGMPLAALMEAEREAINTAEKTLEMIVLSKNALITQNQDDAKKVLRMEDEVDESCRDNEDFIDKIREEELKKIDAIWRVKLLAILTDIERVGDLASNIAEFAIEEFGNGAAFSEQGAEAIAEMFDLVEETYSTAIKSLKTKNKELAKVAERLEDEVDILERKL